MPAARISCGTLSKKFFTEMYKMRDMGDCDFFIVTERKYRVHPEIEGDAVKYKIISKDSFSTLTLYHLLCGDGVDVEYIEYEVNNDSMKDVIIGYIEFLYSEFLKMQVADSEYFLEEMLSESFDNFFDIQRFS